MCRVCCELVPSDHLCYVRPMATASGLDKFRYIIFDFETYAYEPDDPAHEVKLAKALHLCNWCEGFPLDRPCEEDALKPRMRTFDSCGGFMEWVISPENLGSICLAHNMRGYDGYFCIQWLINNGFTPNVIMNGGKIVTIELRRLKITFRDTLSFIPCTLAGLAPMFGLEASKGFFPHKFNTKENANYVGVLPEKRFFSPETMKAKTLTEFNA